MYLVHSSVHLSLTYFLQMIAWFFCKAEEQEMMNLNGLLKIYESASEENINYSRSAILFSKIVGCDRKVFLSSILGVKCVDDLGNYLGVHLLLLRISQKILTLL